MSCVTDVDLGKVHEGRTVGNSRSDNESPGKLTTKQQLTETTLQEREDPNGVSGSRFRGQDEIQAGATSWDYPGTRDLDLSLWRPWHGCSSCGRLERFQEQHKLAGPQPNAQGSIASLGWNLASVGSKHS